MKLPQSKNYPLPPVVETERGETRRVGFELEFSGISPAEAAAAVATVLSGKIKSETAAETRIQVGELGEFTVELDWDYLKRRAAEDDTDHGEHRWLEILSEAAALLVPVEVVCPPIPVTELSALDPMVDALRRTGAVGTEESLLAAYGVHINIEIPALDSVTLHRYLQAYALLQWWLVDAHEVDPTRKLSPYVDLYPEAYLHRVLSRETPDMREIFADYLEYNPTRNRALDLLPLLKEIDPRRIEREVDDPRVKARPTFHYRLPNCNIERDAWSLAPSWNAWLVVERLAVQPDKLAQLSNAFDRAQRPVFGVNRDEWVQRMHRWLVDHGLV